MTWSGECVFCLQPFEADTKEKLVAAYMPHYEASRRQVCLESLRIFYWEHLCNGLKNVIEDGISRQEIGLSNFKAEEEFGNDPIASAYGLRKREGD